MIEMQLLKFSQLKQAWLLKLKKILIWKICGLSGIVLFLFIIMAIYSDRIQNSVTGENRDQLSKPKSNSNNSAIDVKNNTQILSKEAVDALVKSAADKKYLEDVLNATTNLSPPKRSIPLQPLPSVLPEISLTHTSQIDPKESGKSQRCHYKEQIYVAGDIVNTQKGWIRCTPTLVFSQDNNDEQQGNLAWVAVH